MRRVPPCPSTTWSVSPAACAALCLSLFASACGGASESGTTTASGAPEGWPEELLVGEGHGPALFNGPDATAAAIGYIAENVRVRVVGAPQGDRIPVRIDGPFKVRAWLPLARLAGRVHRRGKLRGAPLTLGVNDLIGVRGAADGGRMVLEASPRFGLTPEPAVGPFEGSFPASAVGADVVEVPAVAATEVERARLPSGRAVEVYDHPRGHVVATLPALTRGLTVEVARRREDWTAIRAGRSPFLVGWVQGALETPDPVEPAAPVAAHVAAAHDGPPLLLENDAAMPLWRVRTRARVRFDGVTIGRLADRGWAREMRRTPDGEVDVFVAVDDDVAVRGMVSVRDLEPVEAGAVPQTPDSAATTQRRATAPLSDAARPLQ